MSNFWHNLGETLANTIRILAATILSGVVLAVFVYALLTIFGGTQ